MSKWNVKFAHSFGSNKVNRETLNKGASFLVAPHNMSYNKHAVKVSDKNHQKVIDDLETILNRHKEEEEKQMKGLSEEMAA